MNESVPSLATRFWEIGAPLLLLALAVAYWVRRQRMLSAHRYELSDGGKLRLGGGEGGGGLRRTWGRGSGRAGKKGRRIREAGKALFNRIASTNRKNGGSGGFGQYDSGDESGDMEMTEEGNPLMNVRI